MIMAPIEPKDTEELLTDVVTYCSQQKFPRNILLVGHVGSGKSSMVNTILKALLGPGREFVPQARVGAGHTSSQTLSLTWYQNCGLTTSYLDDSYYRDILSDSHKKLPNIIDMAGLGDEDTPARREILQLLLEGRIEIGTTIAKLEKDQLKYGVGNLHQVYRQDPNLKVTNIVFVQNGKGKEKPPQNLIKCLREVTRTTNPKTGQLVYTGEMFVVITGMDMHKQSSVEGNGAPLITGSQEVTPARGHASYTMQELESTIAKAFVFEGSKQQNLMWWTNYCDEVGYNTNPIIDTSVLRFLKRMVMVEKVEEVARVSPWRRSLDAIMEQPDVGVVWQEVTFLLPLLWLTLLGKMGGNDRIRLSALAIIIAVVAVVLWYCFKKPL